MKQKQSLNKFLWNSIIKKYIPLCILIVILLFNSRTIIGQSQNTYFIIREVKPETGSGFTSAELTIMFPAQYKTTIPASSIDPFGILLNTFDYDNKLHSLPTFVCKFNAGTSYTKNMSYVKGVYHQTCSILNAQNTLLGTFIFDIDDPIYVEGVTSFDVDVLKLTYSKFYDNGKAITVQFQKGSGGSWTTIPNLTLSYAGGEITTSLVSYLSGSDMYNTGINFRILKTLSNTAQTVTFGNTSGPNYFYDFPTISLSSSSVVCADQNITLTGGYKNYPSSSPSASLEVITKEAYDLNNNASWTTISGVTLTDQPLSLNFATIKANYSNATLGREIYIRPYKMFNGTKKINGTFKSVVFLPSPNVTITAQAPTCYGGQDANITLKFNDVPPTGCVDPTNASVPIILTVYQYGLDALSNDVTYSVINIAGTNYFYHNGGTMIQDPDLSGTNEKTYYWSDFGNNFKFERGMYQVKATINSGTAQCPASSGFQYLDAPIPFTASAIAQKVTGYPSYNVKTGDNQGSVIFKFHGGTAPYEIRKDNATGVLIKSLPISELTADSTYTLSVSTDQTETTTRTYYLKDKYNCQNSGPVTVYFIRPSDITIARSDSSKTSCNTTDNGDHGNGMVSWIVAGGYDASQSSIALYRLPDKTNEISATITRKSGGIIEFTGGNITKGYYVIKVTDKMNPLYSVWSTPILVDEPNALNINITPHNPTCDYKNDGWIDISTTGGNGGYSYTVMKGASPVSDYSQGLSDGTYSITVTDSRFCSQLKTQPLTDPQTLTINAIYSHPASCSAVPNGTATATVKNFRNNDSYVTFKIGTTTLAKSYNGNNIFYLSGLRGTENSLITVIDTYSNCEASDTILIPLNNPQFSAVTSTLTPAPCTGKIGIIKLATANMEGDSISYSMDGGPVNKIKSSFQNIPFKGSSYHTITVTDVKSGCPVTLLNVSVGVRPDSLKLKPIVATSPAWCTTSNSGQATVNTLSGWGVLNFKISPTDSTNTGVFPDLLPGLYTVVANDDSLCKSSVSFTVPVSNDSLNISLTNPIKAACKGESYTGELKASRLIAGKKTGFGGISYTLNAIPVPDSVFSNLKSGLYTVAALDAKNCSASITDSVKFDTNPVAFTIDSLYDQRCTEVKNAKYFLKAHTLRGSDQTFRFVYNSDTTVWHADTISYFVKTAGNYSFKVIDRNNCGNTLNHTIVNLHYAPKPKLDFPYPVACNHATDGYLSIYNTPNNSVPTYKYQLGTRTLYAGSANQKVVFDGLSKGYQIITATDTLGCQDTARFVVNVRSDSLKISRIDTTSATCIAAQNGMAKIVAASFDNTVTANKYTFLCNGNTLKGDSVTFTMLPVKKTGVYSVTVTDQYGCSDTHTFPMSVRKDTIDLWQRLLVNAACPGSSDGNIKVRRINGNTSYRYQVTSTANGLIQNFYSNDTLVLVSGLPEGTYKISVKDTNNCVAAINNIPVTQPQAIDFSNYSRNYIKHKGQPEGQMNAAVKLGNGKYNYEWRNLSGNSLISSGKTVEFANIQLSNQLAGDYLLRVRDTANCFVGSNGWLEKQFTIVEPQQDLALSVKRLRRVSCFGLSDGEFQLKASGGWGNNYQYGFDALHLYADSVFSNRSIGTVTMFAKDTSGVIVSLPVTITQPDLLTASLASKTDANCFESADGSATASILGGNTPKYFVSSDNANWTPGNTLTGLTQGSYIMYIRDSLNCSTTVPFTINQPSQIVRTGYHITDTRCGFGNGIITAKINGGVPGYNYQWYKGTTLLSSVTDSVSQLFSGSYRLAVTDTHNCTMNFPFNVSDITDLTIDTILTHPVTCWGYSDGSATAQLSKGNPPYIVTWPDSTHLTSVAGLKTGTYSIWVTDQEKCNVFKDFTIETPVNIYLNSKTITDPLCEGVNDGALDVTANGSFSGFTYVWNTGSTRNSIKNLSPGNYTLTVTDDHNCSNHFDFALNYQQYAKPNLGADLTLCKGNTFRLQPGLFSDYKWTSSNSFSSRQPEVYVDQPGAYFVEVTDNYGCIGRDTIKISQSVSELQAKLLIASNVEQNDTIVIFEASWPLPDSVNFQLNGCKVLSSGTYYREVIFSDTGTYVIGLTSYMNDCLDMVSKTVKVDPKSSNQLKSASLRLIQSFNVSPNPSDGQFTAEIKLRENSAIQLHLANVSTGVITDIREYKNTETYNITYSLNNLTPGMYVLHLQAGKETKTKILIIQK
jgi:hypothetical protein